MALKLVTAPASEPVSLTEAKAHLRVDGTAEDTIIGLIITAAREWAEKATGRVFITQTWDMWLDSFPVQNRKGDAWWDGVQDGAIGELLEAKRFVELPKGPIQSVTHLKTFNSAGTEETFASSDYFVDTASVPGRLALNSGVTWPSVTLRPVNGIQIQYVAGYGAASAVPAQIRLAILMLVAHWFENREALVTGTISKELELGTRALLQPFEVVRL